ncbi:MAG: hypothetical protein LV480_02375 [Methylacidiphilales bacterium]|nr:hypothetical protein [Candidatus Methylacidiphilales bacterium]
MTTTLPGHQLPVQTINSNHAGSEFGVVLFDAADAGMSLDECLSLLAEDGWTNSQEVPSPRAGVRKFLVSRKK